LTHSSSRAVRSVATDKGVFLLRSAVEAPRYRTRAGH
jgi:hypothetical protein